MSIPGYVVEGAASHVAVGWHPEEVVPTAPRCLLRHSVWQLANALFERIKRIVAAVARIDIDDEEPGRAAGNDANVVARPVAKPRIELRGVSGCAIRPSRPRRPLLAGQHGNEEPSHAHVESNLLQMLVRQRDGAIALRESLRRMLNHRHHCPSLLQQARWPAQVLGRRNGSRTNLQSCHRAS